MKKLILLLTLVAVSFSGDFFKGMENPNGKPFTLSIRASIINLNNSGSIGGSGWEQQECFLFGYGICDDNQNEHNLNLYFKMPISNILTISGGFYKHIYDSGSNQTFHHNSSLSMSCHLPLYKMWE